jgi:hypothetical protein
MKIHICAAIILAATAATAGRLAARQTEVNIVVDMTPDGRKVAPPSPARPARYLPLVLGYKEIGAPIAGSRPPLQNEVLHLVALELARQGYLVMSKTGPAPSLILLFQWGSMNPQIETFFDENPGQRVFANEPQMLALVSGDTLQHMDLEFQQEQVRQAAEESRYFVALTAFDYNAYTRHHKKVKLWQAKISLPSAGVSIDEAMPALIKAGGPLFGRETPRPKRLILPVTDDGRVDIGALTVKDYQDAPPPPPAPAAAAPQPAGEMPH